MNENGFRIKTIHAFLSVDPVDQSEGVISYRAPDGQHFPLVAADESRLKDLRALAKELAETHQVTIKLARFSVRSDVETFDGKN